MKRPNAMLAGMLRPLGAGPGPGRTYEVDGPFGTSVPITVPVDAIADDFYNRIAPKLDAGAQAAVVEIKNAVSQGVSEPLQKALESGTIVVEQASSKVSLGVVLASFLAGAVAGWGATKVFR